MDEAESELVRAYDKAYVATIIEQELCRHPTNEMSEMAKNMHSSCENQIRGYLATWEELQDELLPFFLKFVKSSVDLREACRSFVEDRTSMPQEQLINEFKAASMKLMEYVQSLLTGAVSELTTSHSHSQKDVTAINELEK